MKIKLITDFNDIYDHWFCGSYDIPDCIFDRRTNIGMNRLEIFKYLKLNGIKTIPYWNNTEYNILYENFDIVVYLDENSHQGKDKIKVPYREAFNKYQGYLFSEYIDSKEKSTSYRYLRINNKEFWLKYQSDDEWRSNVGNVNIEILYWPDRSLLEFDINYPLFAIDFVKDKFDNMYAVDFNISPGLKHTGIEEYIKPREIYQEIENWYKDNNCE